MNYETVKLDAKNVIFDLKERKPLQHALESIAKQFGVEKAIAHIVALGTLNGNKGYMAYLEQPMPTGPNMIAEISLDGIPPGLAITRIDQMSQTTPNFLVSGSEGALNNTYAPEMVEHIFQIFGKGRDAKKDPFSIILEPGTSNHMSVFAGNSRPDNWKRVKALRPTMNAKRERQSEYYATQSAYLPTKDLVLLAHNIDGGSDITFSEASLSDLWNGGDHKGGEIVDRPQRFSFKHGRVAMFGRLMKDDIVPVGLRPSHDTRMPIFKMQHLAIGASSTKNIERIGAGSELTDHDALTYGSPLGMPDHFAVYKITEIGRVMQVMPISAFVPIPKF